MTRARGFTLVEMAIVLMIVAFLLGGLLGPVSAQLENQRVAETERLIIDIRDAMVGYSLRYGALPCPADGSLATGDANAGTGKCTVTEGVVPWVDLGVRETDAWGRRFSYSVTAAFRENTRQQTGCPPAVTTANCFQLSSTANLAIAAAVGGSSIAIEIPAVVVSHGPNGFGAYQPSGGSRLPAGSDADEQENSDADQNFVSHGRTPTYDDQVFWLSRHVLFNRMVAAGKLP